LVKNGGEYADTGIGKLYFKEDMVKKILCAIAAAFAMTTLFALDSPFFSGYAGIMGDITNDSSSTTFAPQMTTQAFFAGQFEFGGCFLLRSELSLKTDDILKNGLFKETDSKFKVNELSITFHQRSLSASHFISLFLGNYEPIGSDVFLQRQFGIKPITSLVTESWNGMCGSSVYPFYGMGGSYVVRFEQPFAVGLYAFANNDDTTSENVLNLDLRFACVLRNFSFDFSAGLAFPHEQSISETGEKVVLLIRTETLHAGFNMLLGNRYALSLFIQAGFSNLDLSPDDGSTLSIDSDNLYVFFEPRLATRQFTLNLSVFSIPQESIDDMLYLHDTLGANLCIVTDHLYLENTNFTFGIHTTLSFPSKSIMDAIEDYANILSWDRKLYVTPFTSMPLLNGELKSSVSVSCLDLASDWKSAIKATVGFKTQM
jgi:hypothetical protein